MDEHPDLVSNSSTKHCLQPLCFMATSSSEPMRNAEILPKKFSKDKVASEFYFLCQFYCFNNFCQTQDELILLFVLSFSCFILNYNNPLRKDQLIYSHPKTESTFDPQQLI